MKRKESKQRKFRFAKGAVARNAQKQGQSGPPYLRLPKGVGIFRETPRTRVELDILPYVVSDPNHPDRDDEYGIAVPGSLWYKRPFWVHRNIGPNNETVLCLSSVKQRCPICEYRAKLLKEGADWNDESVKALKPSMRNLYVVVPKNHKDYPEKPHVWEISQYLFQARLNEEIQEDETYETFPDLEEGYTLQLRFSESSIGSNKFAEVSRIDFKPREKPYDESILEQVPDLDKVLVVPSRKALETLFFSGLDIPLENDEDEDVDEDVDEEEDDEVMTSSEDEDEDDDEDEDEGEDDEDEDDDDEDDEDEDEGDEDDDEDEDEDDDEDVEPVKSTSRRGGKDRKDRDVEKDARSSGQSASGKPPKQDKASKGTKVCPYRHKFGQDCDKYDDCDKCSLWDDCYEASED